MLKIEIDTSNSSQSPFERVSASVRRYKMKILNLTQSQSPFERVSASVELIDPFGSDWEVSIPF